MAGTNTEAAVKPKQLMPHGVWNIEDGGHFVRLLMPTDKGRKCAPCKKETNLCCGGKSSVHIRATDTLALPALQWLRVRISSEEWTDFVAALDTANLEGTVAFAPCEVFPCSFPLLPCQCLLCCVPMQYLAGKALATENALNLAVEKYNKYLFMPRGIVARRQRQCHRPDGREFKFLRIDLAPMPGGPVVHSMLPYGLQPLAAVGAALGGAAAGSGGGGGADSTPLVFAFLPTGGFLASAAFTAGSFL